MFDLTVISTVDRSAALINVLLSKASSDLTSSSIAVTPWLLKAESIHPVPLSHQ